MNFLGSISGTLLSYTFGIQKLFAGKKIINAVGCPQPSKELLILGLESGSAFINLMDCIFLLSLTLTIHLCIIVPVNYVVEIKTENTLANNASETIWLKYLEMGRRWIKSTFAFFIYFKYLFEVYLLMLLA